MQLSPEQSRALDAIALWLKELPKPFYYLTGPAGSGKTTLAKHIAATWSGPVVAMAYTGKAALVLTRAGLPATTIHRKLYLPLAERNEEADQLRRRLAEEAPTPPEIRRITKRLEELNSPTFTLRSNAITPDTLIILDECSMVDAALAADLLSFKAPILVLGDVHQLPPINGEGYFTRSPDFSLETVHRQAAESPVIRLATMAREGRPLPHGPMGSSLVTTRRAVSRELALSCSQIICGSNKARRELNADMRGFLGYDAPLPMAGERLICLRNNPRDSLLNGQIIELHSAAHPDQNGFVTIRSTEGHVVQAHRKCFSDPDALKTWSYASRAKANEFDYGYAVTAHKAQGSEWESVLVWADMFRWDKETFKRWLYTAITRASEKVVVAL